MTQLDLLTARDTHLTEPAELRRLSGQNGDILARLQHGPATNFELAQLSIKYTSRISDLRKAGYDVKVIERDYTSGMTLYKLVGN